MSTVESIPCPHGCGPVAVPLRDMNRAPELREAHPKANLGCPACGRVWRGSRADVAQAKRAAAAWDANAARLRKDERLRERLAAAPKAVTRG